MANKLNYHRNAYTKFFTVAPGVWGMKDLFVNLYMILNPFDGNWVLIDTGLKWSAPKIKKMASQLFGANSKPSSIILTHGHFDHVGALRTLLEHWHVPVFAHYLEVPYLTGKSYYPPPDAAVGGGLISLMSWMYPYSPINVSHSLVLLPENGRVPGLPEWKYIHTPGHAPGHISLYRETDGVLVSGDALVTTKAESVLATMFQYKKLSGPPRYFTYDWILARESVKKLANLEPELVASGHGQPLHGAGFRQALQKLSEHFYTLAVPATGRYTNDYAITNATGVVYTPPRNFKPRKLAVKLLSAVAITAFLCTFLMNRSKKSSRIKAALSYEVW